MFSLYFWFNMHIEAADPTVDLPQAAVLTELHHLQLLSPHAKHIIETVLVKRGLVVNLTPTEPQQDLETLVKICMDRIWSNNWLIFPQASLHSEGKPMELRQPGELLRALTAEQLMAVGSAEDLAKARRRLRAMQRNRGVAGDGAREIW